MEKKFHTSCRIGLIEWEINSIPFVRMFMGRYIFRTRDAGKGKILYLAKSNNEFCMENDFPLILLK